MADHARETGPFSAAIQMWLDIGGEHIGLVQVAPDRVIAEQARELVSCDADVVLLVDGSEHRRRVHLPDGMSARSPVVRTVTANEPPF